MKTRVSLICLLGLATLLLAADPAYSAKQDAEILQGATIPPSTQVTASTTTTTSVISLPTPVACNTPGARCMILPVIQSTNATATYPAGCLPITNDGLSPMACSTFSMMFGGVGAACTVTVTVATDILVTILTLSGPTIGVCILPSGAS